MLPPPSTFGLPDKFREWRSDQSDACESILDPEPRFLLQVCPTGFGKSVTYMTAALLNPGRTIILTSTKGLQTQLINDFGGIDGVVDIRGRGNYPCRLNSRVNCDMGICVFGVHCSMKDEGGCFYFDKLKEARRAKVVITNYSYWMYQNEYGEGIGDFTLMVLDEAHSSPDHLVGHIGVSFSKKNQVESRMLDLNLVPNDYVSWRDWAESHLLEAEGEMEAAKESRKEKRYLALKRLVDKLKKLVERINSNWVWEDNPYSVELSPTWPAPYAETILFNGIPKVLFTSATAVPKTAKLLGVRAKHEEYPHSFPVENRPLTHIPTVRMNYRNGPYEERLWLNRLDQILKTRIGTKGIIHTISYARRDLVLDGSKFKEHMITHSRQDTESVVRTFKTSSAPCILVSPSMATGWDFPDDECRWQIIVKLPYPDTRGAIMKARAKEDKDYINYIVAQQLVQATGRGTRSITDWCETFILDDNIEWYFRGNQHLLVNWFKGAYKTQRTVPKLERR